MSLIFLSTLNTKVKVWNLAYILFSSTHSCNHTLYLSFQSYIIYIMSLWNWHSHVSFVLLSPRKYVFITFEVTQLRPWSSTQPLINTENYQKRKKKIQYIHCRMRSPSSALVMAANQTSAIGVLFDVDYDVIVRNGCFQRGTTLKFLKNLWTFFLLILGQRHWVLIPV